MSAENRLAGGVRSSASTTLAWRRTAAQTDIANPQLVRGDREVGRLVSGAVNGSSAVGNGWSTGRSGWSSSASDWNVVWRSSVRIGHRRRCDQRVTGLHDIGEQWDDVVVRGLVDLRRERRDQHLGTSSSRPPGAASKSGAGALYKSAAGSLTPCQRQRQRQRRALRRDRRALVMQRRPAHLLQHRDPPLRTRRVLVVAGDEVGTQPRPHIAEWLNDIAHLVDRAVHDVTDDRDQVPLQLVARRSQPADEVASAELPKVQVAEHDDP